jgi:hypothetical protein
MNWMEWVIAGVFIIFLAGLGTIVRTAIRHANKS